MEPKKKKAKKSVASGTVLVSGNSTWSQTVDTKKVDKMLVTPHRFATMEGRKVIKAVTGPAALHGILITKQGSAFSFGRNEHGQLGQGDEKDRSFPRKVSVGPKVIDAACGRNHTLLLTEDGEIFAFGDNHFGQLGIGQPKTIGKSSPIKLQTDFGGRITKVACGSHFSIAINNNGTVFAWGHPDKGCLGNGTTGEFFISASKLSFHFEWSPIIVSGFFRKPDSNDTAAGIRGEKTDQEAISGVVAVDVACGTEHTVLLDNMGRIFTWGFGGYGRLGHNGNTDVMSPRLVELFSHDNVLTGGAVRIGAGGCSSFAETKVDPRLFFWGQTKMSGEATMYPKPLQEIATTVVGPFAIGQKHCVAVTKDGTYSWGASPCYGELGLGEGGADGKGGRSSTTPQQVLPLADIPVIDVSCGHSMTLWLVNGESSSEATASLAALPVLGTVTAKGRANIDE